MASHNKSLFGLLLGMLVCVAPTRAQIDTLRYEVNVSKYLMGTRVEATVMHSDVNAAQQALVRAFLEMERVEQLLSLHLETSEIARLNREAAATPVRVRAETFGILQRAQAYAARFEGLFDVTIGPVTALWGFNSDAPIAVPDVALLDSVSRLVNFRKLILNERDTTVFFARPGMRLDLGGIAKGYAIDRAVQVLRNRGVANFLFSVGGDLYASGERYPGEPWRVGVKHPRNAEALLAKLIVRDGAVATSGDYERFAEINGRRYHHIIDPRTGYPAQQSRSITVLAPTAEEADVLATCLFILGIAHHTAQTGLSNYLGVDAEGHVYFDPSLIERQALQIFE